MPMHLLAFVGILMLFISKEVRRGAQGMSCAIHPNTIFADGSGDYEGIAWFCAAVAADSMKLLLGTWDRTRSVFIGWYL